MNEREKNRRVGESDFNTGPKDSITHGELSVGKNAHKEKNIHQEKGTGHSENI